MRRPICLLAASFGTGIFFGFYMESSKLIILSFIYVFMMLFILKRDKSKALRKILCWALIFFLSGAFNLFIHANKKDDMLSFIGKDVMIEGMVSSIQQKDTDRYQLIIKTSKEKSKVLVNIYGDIENENYGDIAGRNVQISGIIELPSERRNPKTFDYRLYLQTKSIHVLMNIKPDDMIVVDGDINVFINILSNIRYNFMHKIINTMDIKNAGILIGMLFGDKNTLDDDIYEMFQKNGTAHILAVSGLHVGVVYVFLNKLLKSRRNIFLNIVLLFFLFVYVALSSFAPSALRAGGMITLHILSKLLCRRYDMLCAGAAMAFVLMFFNPLIIFDMGFQLSFLAIFTLAIALPAMRRIYDSDMMAVISLQVSLAPVTAYLFNYFSIAAFFINAPVIFIAGMIIPVGIVLIPLSYIPGPVFHVCAGLLDALCGVLYKLNELTYVKGGLFYNVASPPLWAIFIFYGLLFCGCSEAMWIFFKRKQNKKLILTVLMIIVLSFVSTAPVHDDFHKAQLIFVDVGQGDCLHIKTPGGKNILIDGGGSHNFDVGKKVLMPYLLKNGVHKIDIAFVSHRHLDHYGGLVSLAKSFSMDKLCFYEANQVIEEEILIETGLQREQIVYLAKGQKIKLDEDIWVEILYPEKKTASEYIALTGENADENDISLIMKVHYYGVSVLMTGDLNSEGESRLLDIYDNNNVILKSDFLKVGHHGSKYSSSDEFLAEVNPDFAVFQVGKNGFGHPTNEVLEKCMDIDAEIYRNDKQGAIGVFIKKGQEKPVIKSIIEID